MSGLKESPGQRLMEVRRDETNSMYTVRWADGHSSKYPFVWLSDNCRCSECYQASCYQRLILMKNTDPEIKPTSEEIAENGSLLRVTWTNAHVGEYPSSWLWQHKFDKGVYDPIADLELRPWGPEIIDALPRFKVADVLASDDVLSDWLTALSEIGLALLVDAPTKPGIVKALANRVAIPRPTAFGETFHVFSKNDSSSIAYTEQAIGPHVDVPCLYFCPGVQLLHCIRQTRTVGGENQFYDTYNAALILKRDYPKVYDLLKSVKINYRIAGIDEAREYHYIASRPIIEEDDRGNFRRINFSNHLRASYMNVPVDQVQDVYRAMKLFHDILFENEIQIRLNDGEIATMDNRRVMHARSTIEIGQHDDAESVRHYEGTYVDWDEVYSRLRVLREKKNGQLRV